VIPFCDPACDLPRIGRGFRRIFALVMVPGILLGCGDTLYDPADDDGPAPPPGTGAPTAGAPRAVMAVEAPDRIELTDSLVVRVTAWDSTAAVGITAIGYTAVIRGGDPFREFALSDSVRLVPRPLRGDTTSVSFTIRPGWISPGALPSGFQMDVYGFAWDSTGTCASVLPETGTRIFPCSRSSVGGDSVTVAVTRPRAIPVLAVVGRTVPFPSPLITVGDLRVDTIRGNLFVSNRLSNRLHVLQPTTFTWLSDVSIGSEPWGLHFNRTGDTLLVANSGGTSVSSVVLSTTPREAVERRLQTRNTPLFEFDVEAKENRLDPTVTDTIVEVARFLDFSDRPQFVAQDNRGLLLYSTRPTGAAPRGTVRVIENRPGWTEPETRILARMPKDLVANEGTVSVVNADSILFYEGGFIEVWDHQPGFPERVIRSGIQRPLDALRTMDTTLSDVDWRLDAQWDLDAVSFADTTYVAASRDRSYVAFGDGGQPAVGRIVLWEASSSTISRRMSVSDLVNNASERVQALELNRNGQLGLARGAFGTYFFSNDLRLRGTALELVPGGGGAALHPDHPDTPAPLASSDVTLAFTVSGDRSIRVLDTVHYGERGRIPMRDPIAGPLRVTPPLPSDNAGQGRNCSGPDCVVVKVFAVTSTGGVVVIDVRARDIRRLP
jgi:hypothetical protein